MHMLVHSFAHYFAHILAAYGLPKHNLIHSLTHSLTHSSAAGGIQTCSDRQLKVTKFVTGKQTMPNLFLCFSPGRQLCCQDELMQPQLPD